MRGKTDFEYTPRTSHPCLCFYLVLKQSSHSSLSADLNNWRVGVRVCYSATQKWLCSGAGEGEA
jgi:hypothetical protein